MAEHGKDEVTKNSIVRRGKLQTQHKHAKYNTRLLGPTEVAQCGNLLLQDDGGLYHTRPAYTLDLSYNFAEPLPANISSSRHVALLLRLLYGVRSQLRSHFEILCILYHTSTGSPSISCRSVCNSAVSYLVAPGQSRWPLILPKHLLIPALHSSINGMHFSKN